MRQAFDNIFCTAIETIFVLDLQQRIIFVHISHYEIGYYLNGFKFLFLSLKTAGRLLNSDRESFSVLTEIATNLLHWDIKELQ